MSELEPFTSLGLALFAGLLLGLEREQSLPERHDDRSSFIGGARTYPLFALLGAISMLLAAEIGVGLVIAGFVATVLLLGASYVLDIVKRDEAGLTSEAALLLAFVLGVTAATQEVFESTARKASVVASVTVVATLLLSIKPLVQTALTRVTKADVFATLKFLLVAIVILPLLPDATFGPLDVLNPYRIGMLVVLIAGLSFVGYFAVRLLGPQRGLGVTGLVGGLASSTAVTLSLSGQARKEPRLATTCALAVVLASTIMFVRLLVAVRFVNEALVPLLAVPVLAACGAGVVASFWFWRQDHAKGTSEGVKLSNPFELSSALKFAAVFTVVLLVSKYATTNLGAGATYLTGILAGTSDVDAITLSMAALAKEGLAAEVAVTTILLGAASNTAVKGGMAIVLGGWAFGRRVAAAYGAMIVAGAVALAVMRL